MYNKKYGPVQPITASYQNTPSVTNIDEYRPEVTATINELNKGKNNTDEFGKIITYIDTFNNKLSTIEKKVDEVNLNYISNNKKEQVVEPPIITKPTVAKISKSRAVFMGMMMVGFIVMGASEIIKAGTHVKDSFSSLWTKIKDYRNKKNKKPINKKEPRKIQPIQKQKNNHSIVPDRSSSPIPISNQSDQIVNSPLSPIVDQNRSQPSGNYEE